MPAAANIAALENLFIDVSLISVSVTDAFPRQMV
jgi:hypothetical protein